MADRTCAIDGCEKTLLARGWCATHYTRWRKHGDPGPRENLIRGRYDDPKVCSIGGCNEKAISRGWCTFHYTRWRLTGDPATPLSRTQYPKATMCAFPGCDGKRRKLGWCSSHYGQHRRGAELAPLVKKSGRDTCIACGEPSGRKPGMRKFCSERCQQLWYRYDGKIPETYDCVHCGDTFPLVVEGRRRIRSIVKFCNRCRQDIRKHGVSVSWLADRDGIECGICGKPVDMTAKFPDPMRPSVDHILARANGGTNEPENLQLAHLWCNQVKSDRTVFTLVEPPLR